MDTKKINGCIGRLAEMARGWETEENVDPIERDVALEMLRVIYAALKFGDLNRSASQEERPAQRDWSANEGKDESPAREMPVAAIPVSPPLSEPVRNAVREAEPASTRPEEDADPATVPSVPYTPQEEPSAAALEPQPLPEPKPLSEPKPLPEKEVTPVIPRRVDPDVIRSLYGDQSTATAPPEPETPPEVFTEKQFVETCPETPQSADLQTAPATTIGDIMNGGRQTLGETLQSGAPDMASRIAAAERPDLRQSIGLNDKFLMIRDMFNGNAEAFNDAIAYLDTFTDLDEAVIWIHETYNWSADSDGVKLLIDLLERKLG